MEPKIIRDLESIQESYMSLKAKNIVLAKRGWNLFYVRRGWRLFKIHNGFNTVWLGISEVKQIFESTADYIDKVETTFEKMDKTEIGHIRKSV